MAVYAGSSLGAAMQAPASRAHRQRAVEAQTVQLQRMGPRARLLAVPSASRLRPQPPPQQLRPGGLRTLGQRRQQRRRCAPRPATAAAGLEGALAVAQSPLVRDVTATLGAALGSKLLVRFFYILEAKELIDAVGRMERARRGLSA